MAGPKTKGARLDELLDEMTVAEFDHDLSRLSRAWLRTYTNRQLRAKEEGNTTPPPEPPVPPGFEKSVESTIERTKTPRSAADLKTLKPPRKVRMQQGGSLDLSLQILAGHPRGLALPLFRQEYEKIDTAEPGKLDRAYHKAISRLKVTGHVILYKNRLFTYDNILKFINGVANGTIEDFVEEPKKLSSRWLNTALDYINGHKGAWVHYRDIVSHIAKQPGFERNTNVGTQTAVTLRRLHSDYKEIEKAPEGSKGWWRAKIGPAPPIPVADNKIKAAEASASAARH